MSKKNLPALADKGAVVTVQGLKIEVAERAPDDANVANLSAFQLTVVTELPEELRKLSDEVVRIEEDVNTAVVEKLEQRDSLALIVGRVHTLQKSIEESRKELTRPIDRLKDGIMAMVKPMLARLSAVETAGGQKIVKFNREENERRRKEAAEQQRKLREQREARAIIDADRLQAQGRPDEAARILDAAESKPIAPVRPAALPPAPGMSIGPAVEFAIVDPDAIPREFCVPDEKLIKSYVKTWGMKTNIPGVEVWENDEKIKSIRSA